MGDSVASLGNAQLPERPPILAVRLHREGAR